MENKTVKYVIIILSVIILLGVITLFFSFQSNTIKAKPGTENNRSERNNSTTVNNNQNATNVTKNIISIPLEKPPFIKD